MASPAINVYSIISPQTLWPPLPYPFPLFICPHYSSSPPIQASRFFRLKPLAIYSTYPFRFRPSFQSPRSIFSQKSQLSDVDEDEDEDEDEDDDDDVAAEEYDSDALGILEQSYEEVELSMEATEISTAPEEFKWQRVEKLLGEVKEFGEGIIDVDELASVYNFRIDKFQVNPAFICNLKNVIYDISYLSIRVNFALLNFFHLSLEASHTSILERIIGGGIGAYQQWQDFDCGGCGCRHRSQEETIVLHDSTESIVESEVSRVSVNNFCIFATYCNFYID